jgi:hypothetical protein
MEGEARVTVAVAGSEISDVGRFVRVPEEWARERRERDTRRSIVLGGLVIVLAINFTAGAIIAIVVWSRRGLPRRVVLSAAGATFLALALSVVNGWTDVTSIFSTAQPWTLQAGGAAFGLLLVALVAGSGIGLVAGLGHSWFGPGSRANAPPWVGPSLGLLVAGLWSMASVLTPARPPLPDYSGASAFLPMFAEPLDATLLFLLVTAGVLALSAATVRFAGHAVYRSIVGFTIVAMGAVIVPVGVRESVFTWIAAALLGVTVIATVVRFSARVPHINGTLSGRTSGWTARSGAHRLARPHLVTGAESSRRRRSCSVGNQ